MNHQRQNLSCLSFVLIIVGFNTITLGNGGVKQDGRDESATPNSKLIASFYNFIIIMSVFSSCSFIFKINYFILNAKAVKA